MSSNDEDETTLQGLKKRRIQRACDICRRKKIRCDGVQMPGNRCSNCIAYNFECTYVEAAKKRGPPKGYVESLENRLVKLEGLLRRLCPNEKLDLDALIDHAPLHPSTHTLPPHVEHHHARDPTEIATSVIRRAGVPAPPVDDVEEQQMVLSENLKRLVVDPGNYRFFGKSSGAMLIQTALELKKAYTVGEGEGEVRVVLGDKREEFWTSRKWEVELDAPEPTHTYTFPPADLMHTLISLYFTHMNLYHPLLHRPTFLSLIVQSKHLLDDTFGSLVLLVCAVGAKYSDDPRTRLDGEESKHSAGWKWFNQVQAVKRNLLKTPGLWDLQKQCLLVQFLQSSSAPQSCWTMVGIGIRVAQDVGAHRRKSPLRKTVSAAWDGKTSAEGTASLGVGAGAGKGPGACVGAGVGEGEEEGWTVEDELWKRAFWCLVCMDRSASAALGRPCAIQDEDFDVDYPLEVDDEYWEHPDPKMRWKQPAGKPSTVTFFNLYLRLHQVLAFTLRTIYSINKSKILLGFVGQQWEQHIVAELDSALNKWVDSVPDHLRWDPTRENLPFFNQSVLLYSSYYHIQILIHRPFIPSPSKPSPLSFPSLAICTNAARSCSHVVDVCRKRNAGVMMPQLQMPSFTSGIVLLLSIWGGKRSGFTADPGREMGDVHKCMQVLRCIETSWHSAGRLWDILYELASVGDLPLPHPSPPVTNKRSRGEESPGDRDKEKESPTPSGSTAAQRTFAGSRRVQKEDTSGVVGMQPQQQGKVFLQMKDPPLHQHQRQHQEQQQRGFLPMYSDELARLPIHERFPVGTGSSSSSSIDPVWYPPVSAPAGYTNNIPSLTQGFAGAGAGAGVDMLFEQGMGYYQQPMDYRGDVLQHQHQHGQMRYQQQLGQQQQQQAFVDSDAVAMWSNAPAGFELDEWGSYLSSVSELTQQPPGHIFPQ